jgi:hypothetical protein
MIKGLFYGGLFDLLTPYSFLVFLTNIINFFNKITQNYY